MSEEEMSQQNVEGKEVEVTEISLDEDEINEWISQLAMLKATKNPIQLEIDDDTELSISYQESEVSGE